MIVLEGVVFTEVHSFAMAYVKLQFPVANSK